MDINCFSDKNFILNGNGAVSNEILDTINQTVSVNNPVGSLVGYYDEQYTISIASEYFLKNFGYTLESFKRISGHSLKNIIVGKNVNWLEPEHFRKLHGSGEGHLLTADGTPIAVLMTKMDAVDVQGVPVWVLSVRMDWAHENLSLINMAIQSGPWYMDCDSQDNITNVYWSHLFREMLGYHDIMDFPNKMKSWIEILHPDDRDVVLQSLRKSIADRSNQYKYDVEYRLRITDGSYHWYRAIAEITRRKDGSAKRIAGIFINIDTEKNNRLALKRADIAFAHLVSSMSRVVDHFAICDLQHDKYEYHNLTLDGKYPTRGQYSELIGFVTKNLKTLPPLQTLAACLSPENLKKSLTSEESIYKFEYCSMDEDVFRMASFVPLEWENGELCKVLWTSTDITDAKQNEIASRKALMDAYRAAQRANKAKTEFLSNMSHDLRTPMNAIVGLTALADANIESKERVRSYLSKISSSSRHLLGLINEVLDMARIESGKVSIIEEDFAMHELIENTVTIIRPALTEHGHSFEVNVRSIRHEAVCGDSMRIQQVLLNFLSNAVKYTPNGGKISLSVEEKSNGFSELGCFDFTIEDNGMGMTPEFQKVMYQPFTRADEKRTTNIPGTGLGMAIAHNIVEMMNGNIAITSAPNQGTRVVVTIYLKLRGSVDSKPAKANGNYLEEIRKEDYSKKRILLVEDNELNREIAVSIISMTKANVEVAVNGAEAVKKVSKAPAGWYDLVLMDIQMPIMNGYEAAAAIRSLSSANASVPIVAMTANAFAEDVQLAKNSGMNEHLAKPLDLQKLHEILQNWLA